MSVTIVDAKTIEDNDAGIIIEEKDLTCELLKQKIDEILKNKDCLDSMAQKAKRPEMKGAMDNIMREILEITKK